MAASIGATLGEGCSFRTDCLVNHGDLLDARRKGDLDALHRAGTRAWTLFDELGCNETPFAERWGHAQYQRVWRGLEGLRAREQAIERANDLQREEAKALRWFDGAFAAAKAKALDQMASSRGFAERRLGLGRFLEHVRETGMPMVDARKVLIQLSAEDEVLKITQVLGSTGLVVHDDVRIFVEADKARLYEGTPVTALGASSYRVSGTRSYSSLAGSRQAFVITRVPELDPGFAPLLDVIKNSSSRGFVAFAEYSNGILAECVDLPPESFEKLVQSAAGFDSETRGATDRLVLQHSCAETFSRPAEGICTFPKGARVAVYARPLTFKGLDESDCTGKGGSWSPTSPADVK